MRIGIKLLPLCALWQIFVCCPVKGADSPTSAPGYTAEQKVALDALDGAMSRYEALVNRDDDATHKAAAQADLDGFNQRRAAIRQNFDQGKIDELRVDLNLGYQRLAAWMKPPSNPPASQPSPTVESLNARFGLASNQLHFAVGEGGLICADIKTSACTARVYLLGGQVTAWQPAGEEPVIFTSSKSQFAVGKAIRGGVPICFPWYDGKAQSAVAGVGGTGGPQHGIVRTIEWQVEETKDLGNGAVSITLGTRSDAASKKFWPGDYELHEHLVLGKELLVELQVKNIGTEQMKYEEDLHTYYFAKDVRKASVAGLNGVEFIDKYDSGKRKTQQGNIALSNAADSVYLNTNGPVTIVDDSMGRRIRIEKTNSQNTMVWTPGSSRAVSDLGPNEWMNYVTIEVTNVGESVQSVAPAETKSTGFRVSVQR